MLIAVWPLGLSILDSTAGWAHTVKTSLSPPVKAAQPPITEAQPIARRVCLAATRKPATSTASGTVTAVSPKSVRKRQSDCKKIPSRLVVASTAKLPKSCERIRHDGRCGESATCKFPVLTGETGSAGRVHGCEAEALECG